MCNSKIISTRIPSFFVRATKKEGKKALARQSLSARPCASSSAPTRIRSCLVGALLSQQGLPLHPPWRAGHPFAPLSLDK